MPSSFNELLQSLAAEHEREVRQLHNEIQQMRLTLERELHLESAIPPIPPTQFLSTYCRTTSQVDSEVPAECKASRITPGHQQIWETCSPAASFSNSLFDDGPIHGELQDPSAFKAQNHDAGGLVGLEAISRNPRPDETALAAAFAVVDLVDDNLNDDGLPAQTHGHDDKQVKWQPVGDKPLTCQSGVMSACVAGMPTTNDEGAFLERKVAKSQYPDATVIERWEMLANSKISAQTTLTELSDVWIEIAQLCQARQQQAPGGGLLGVIADKRIVQTVSKSPRQPMLDDRTGHSTTGVCHYFILHPSSMSRMLWDVGGLVLLTMDLIMIPMQAFDAGDMVGVSIFFQELVNDVDKTSTIFWTIDVMVSFLTGFNSAQGFIEMHPTAIALRYIRTWLIPDVCIVTLDWLMLFKVMESGPNFAKLGKVARVARMARLIRFFKLSTSAKYVRDRINSEYALTLMSLVRLVLFLCLINHYIACGWFWLSRYPAKCETSWSRDKWKSLRSHGQCLKDPQPSMGCAGKCVSDLKPSMGYAYVTSLHWSLTQFTPASMEVTPKNVYERVFNLFIIILAMVTFSSFVSSITNAMTHIRNINARKMEQDAAMRRYFQDHKISHDLASRVWMFIRQNKSASARRTKESEVPAIKLLPQRMRQELRKESCLPVLSLHPLFERYNLMEPEVISRLCTTAVREKSMLTGEELLAGGTDVKEMFFVVQGQMEYIETQTGGMEINFIIPARSWACEIALWAAKAEIDGPILAAAGGSELLLIHRSEFQSAVKGQVDSTAFLASYAELFVKHFNLASKDEELVSPLFNSPEVVAKLTRSAHETVNPNLGKISRKSNRSLSSDPEIVELS